MDHREAAAAGQQKITHVIFDMDGLLLDTEKLYSVAQDTILDRFRKKVCDWDVKVKMMDTTAMESARIFVTETGISHLLSPEDFLREREEILCKLFPKCEMMAGALRLGKYLHSNTIPICVATGSGRRHFELKTEKHCELFSMMDHIVVGDDPEVKRGKPSPDLFLTAAKRFKGGHVHPGNVLVFEDAPNGVLAAKTAGMYVVMVPDPNLDSSYRGKPDQVLNSLLDFNPSDWGLPPFQDEPKVFSKIRSKI